MQLPIHDCLADLLKALRENNHAVLQAPPGAGKTTQVPLSLLSESWLGDNKILVLEPRRVAAINAANRMAQMLGEPVGQTVGYRMRQASKTSDKTRIEVITEGLLTRWLQDDPELAGVGIIVFDEFHERSLNTDVGLALALQARELFRNESNPLKILVMSATLDSKNVAQLFNDNKNDPNNDPCPSPCPVITSQGRSYPVELRYQPSTRKTPNSNDIIPDLIRVILHSAENETGSILVFLPGAGEINRVLQALNGQLPADTQCYPLHGSLSLNDQQHAIAAPNNTSEVKRKIVLATDIAETSLTIEGIRIVIDCGLARSPQFDPNTGITRLFTQGISEASAEQRAGRAGRLEPGICYRLWSEAQHQQKLKHSTPEIINADLMPLALTLLNWGVNHFAELQWINPPNSANWQQALDSLKRIGALDEHGQLTESGNRLAQFPCHPRLGQLLISAERYGASQLGAYIAAILSERTPKTLGCDLHTSVVAVQNNDHHADKHWRQRVMQLARQFKQMLRDIQNQQIPDDDLIGLLIAKAFPESIAKRKSSNKEVAVFQLANGRGAQLPAHEPLAHQTWLSIAEAGGIAGKSQDAIYIASQLNPELFSSDLKDLVEDVTIAQWDNDKARFIAENRQLIGKIIVQQKAIQNIPDTLKTQALIGLIRTKGLDILNWDNDAIQLTARVNFAAEHQKDYWPDLSKQGLIDSLEIWLSPHLTNISTLADFTKINLSQALHALLIWPQPKILDDLAPKSIVIPSGRNASIDYTQTPPVLAVKLQEMFGCSETPTILNGLQKLTIHLLSPAKQPLQVTQDLATFWANGYNDVKKEMKGRYPRHPWPDDPLSMEATAKTKRALARKDV